MQELAKKIVLNMNLDKIVNKINSEIHKVDDYKKDELYSCIIEGLTLKLNKDCKDKEKLIEDESLCSCCHGDGEYEVSAGTHSFFRDCESCGGTGKVK